MSESMQEQIAAAILARRLAEGDVQVEAYNDGLNDAAAVARAFEPAGETVTLAVTDVEALSAQVHEAWMATKREQGITTRPSEWGEEQMVPYVELSERAKDLDRSTVQAVLDAQTVLAAVPPSEHPTVDEGACRCTMLTAQTPWEPADWEQADDCPVHPLAAPPAPHGDSGLRGIALDATRSAYHDDPEVLSTSLTRVANALVQHIAAHPEADA